MIVIIQRKRRIAVIDFGSQTCHLIGRRIRRLGTDVTIVPAKDVSLSKIKSLNPRGIILSGGPSSIYDNGSPTIPKSIFSLNIPTLGICYGLHTIAHLMGGKVISGRREYGPAIIEVTEKSALFKGLLRKQPVWMSHGDEVKTLPEGFKSVAQTDSVKHAAFSNEEKRIFAVQFHPEVSHTKYGEDILKNFLEICGISINPQEINVNTLIQKIKDRVGEGRVIGAVSGGVDSTVAAALISKAIGKNFYPVHVDNGLMRLGTTSEVKTLFRKKFKTRLKIIRAKKLFLKKLKSVTNPEKKRKIIGGLYIKLFQKEAKKIKGAKFLLQGTIYSDVIESKGSTHADKIKSHHNVGGLPKNLKFELIEPLREFYKDEVREIGKRLGLDDSIVNKHPFPGPGQAIRIMGEVSNKRLDRQQKADQIVLEEIGKAGWYDKVFQVFPVLTNTKSTAIKGDGRFYGEVIAIRCYGSSDIMTTDWTKLPYDLLQKISSRIVNEVPGISRVVYDITTKPPATMEWE